MACAIRPSNFTFNHIGHFAAAGHAVAKALFLGGVTRRFPDLRFGFLEGGVGWGCQLFGDLIEHWERRGAKGSTIWTRPSSTGRCCARWSTNTAMKTSPPNSTSATAGRAGGGLAGRRRPLDDYAACNITKKQDWIDLYATPYYFGCEADDRMNAVAFGKIEPFGARINAIYSSDIGHFDVSDMRDPLPEAYELVEDGHISEDDFRDFVFANAVRLWGTQNPLSSRAPRSPRKPPPCSRRATCQSCRTRRSDPEGHPGVGLGPPFNRAKSG